MSTAYSGPVGAVPSQWRQEAELQERIMSRRLVVLVSSVAGVVLAGCVPFKPQPPAQQPNPPAPQPVSVSFACTNGAQTFTVPTGVTTVFVDAFGAQGG